MCVAISLDPGTELTLEEVEKMNRSNSDGVGVSWAKDGVVYWYKTTKVNPNYIHRMISHWKDQPRLVHFRLSTAGGIHAELCHPFEIAPGANCNPVGKGSKVMIHNGHWGRWTDVFDLLKKEHVLPRGPWSDTRLVAYLAWFDEDWLETLGGRVATMDGNGDKVILGSWDKLREGILVSNTHWDHSFSYTRSGKDRYWEGWGREEWEWEEKQRHEEEKARQRAQALIKAQDNETAEKGTDRNLEIEIQAGEGEGQGVGGTGRTGGVGVGAKSTVGRGVVAQGGVQASTRGSVSNRGGRNGVGVHQGGGTGVSALATSNYTDYTAEYWIRGAGRFLTEHDRTLLLQIPVLQKDDINQRKRGVLRLNIETGKETWTYDHSVFRSYYTGQLFRVREGTVGKLECLDPHEALPLVVPAPASLVPAGEGPTA